MHLAILQQLLTSGDGNGVSALAWACNQRHAHCVQLLLNAGDAEAQVASVDRNGVTPLHLCCFYSSTACARLLLAHVPAAQLSAKGTSHSWLLPPGSTPLMVAGRHGRHEMVKLLLQHGSVSRQVTATDNEGSAALHHACIKGHAPVVAALLECSPLETRLVQLAQMNGDFLPAVNLAASLAHPKCLEVLLSHALPPEAFLDMALFASVQAMLSGGQAEGQVDAPEAGPPVPGGAPVAVTGPAAPPAQLAGQGIEQGDGLAGEGQPGTWWMARSRDRDWEEVTSRAKKLWRLDKRVRRMGSRKVCRGRPQHRRRGRSRPEGRAGRQGQRRAAATSSSSRIC